jgi:hypothetical protein
MVGSVLFFMMYERVTQLRIPNVHFPNMYNILSSLDSLEQIKYLEPSAVPLLNLAI